MSDQSRRKLLKSIVAGSGAVIAGKSLPESWVKPVVDSVVLPVHAQTSAFEFSQTLGYNIPQDTTYPPSGGNTIPTQTFTFNVGSAVPTGDGQVDITNLIGDVDFSGETWEIRIGTTFLGETNLAVNTTTVAPSSQWPVPLADLQAALSGGEIVITATQSAAGSVIQTNAPSNIMDVSLTFPAS